MSSEPGVVKRIRVSAFGRSDRGQVRATNQDSLLLADLSTGAPEPHSAVEDSGAVTVGPVEFVLGEAGAILMVADGMGGRQGGARASATAVAAVTETMSGGASATGDDDAFASRLDEALTQANGAIHAEGTREDQYRGMGTTATLAGLRGGVVYVAQVGDSRAYLARKGEIGRLTRDQSLVQEMVDMGILSEEDAKKAPSNQILQAVGVAPTVTPAVTYHELRRGDILLLCSDGLSGVVSDREVQAAIAAAPDCATLCDDLVDLANARGGPDNITVLVARIDGDGVEEAGEGDVVERQPYTPSRLG